MFRRNRRNRTSSAAALTACLALAGCGRPAAPATAMPPTASRPGEPAVDELQRQLAVSLPALLAAELAATEPAGPVVVASLAREAAPLREARLLATVYRSPSAPLRFVDQQRGLSAAGRRLREEFGRLEDHGLPPWPSRDRLTAALAVLSSAEALARPPALVLEDPSRARPLLRRALAALRPLRVAFESLVGEGSPLPGLARSFAEARRARRARLTAAAPVEALLADGLLWLARGLSRGNTQPAELVAQWATPALRPARGNTAAAVVTPTPAARESAIQGRLRRDLESVKDRASLEELLADLPPHQPQYRALQGALRRYRAVVRRGGWEVVPVRTRLPPEGRAHPLVRRLKQRLAVEGWLIGDVDDRVDAPLTQAIVTYQRTHQLEPSGRPDKAFFASLNVPAADRVQAIITTLQRWRESSIGELPYYLLVNVADFHVEVWKRGKLLQRQRVVVGKNSPEKCDEATARKILAHATPLQAAELKTMVFSPYWNVTRTIRETELEPERGKDPEYYEKNGYEIMQPDKAGEWVRQLPGPQNPLGFVKFLFPNPHETYLHDTPEKGLFGRPVRAFSHGCIRVEDAWRLAQLVLTEDGQWDAARFGRLRREWEALDVQRLKRDFSEELYESWCKRAAALETTVALRRSVPVLVEYYTVRVDEAGRVHFLSDIYHLDRDRQKPRAERVCIPESKLARRRFSELPSRLEVLERRARELAPSLERALDARPKLDGRTSWEVRRLLKRAKKLEQFSTQVKNLADRVRAQHEQLAEALDGRERAWSKRQTDEGVRLERLMTGLEKLLREADEVSKATDRMVAGDR